MAHVETVNIGRARPNPHRSAPTTGIDKRAVTGPVEVRDPGPKKSGLGSGLVGDFVGDGRHHGGADQAVYAFAREDLDDWERRLSRPVSNGFFGENLTTRDLGVTDALLGERWQVGDTIVLQVTAPRIPCSTFRGWVGEQGWLKTFTEVARPGAYLRVVVPGFIEAGDPIDIVHRPDHAVTISLTYRAMTTARELLPELLAAGDDLIPELRTTVARNRTIKLG